jgi:hypothetical protein
LEAIIDGSVKTGLDLTPVKQWNQMAITRIVKHGQANANRAMPNVLLDRLPEWLRPQAKVAKHHWLDTLANALDQHKAQYWADVEALATEACPPLEVFEHGRNWLHPGRDLRRVYGDAVRQVIATRDALDTDDFDTARVACGRFLTQWPAEVHPLVLLGCCAYIYAMGPQDGEAPRDSVLWQLGGKRDGGGRDPGIAQTFLHALRAIGLIGEPVWTAQGAVLHYQDGHQAERAGVPITFTAVWFNWLKATRPDTPERMNQVPLSARKAAKQRVSELAAGTFIGMRLTTEVTDNGRVVTRTNHGNLFGFVKPGQELLAVRSKAWEIVWALATDGNVQAIVRPV